jgi:xanthine dehydrogenase YagR molybdenum-binding subunit
MAVGDPRSPLHGWAPEQVRLGGGRIEAADVAGRGETLVALLARHGGGPFEARLNLQPEGGMPGQHAGDYSKHAFGAHFAEVQVDSITGEVRVTRWVGAFGAGRILNVKTAGSQLMGGIIFGIGMALMEHTLTDPRDGRTLTPNLSGYLVPVHTDVPDVDVQFVAENDPHVNPLGVKGIGELGITGAAAAVANAVYHATGRRIRDLPITPDKLL